MKTLIASILLLFATTCFAAVPAYTKFKGIGGILVTTNPPDGDVTIDGTGIGGTNTGLNATQVTNIVNAVVNTNVSYTSNYFITYITTIFAYTSNYFNTYITAYASNYFKTEITAYASNYFGTNITYTSNYFNTLFTTLFNTIYEVGGNDTNYAATASSNNVRVAAGANITVVTNGSAGVTIYTVSGQAGGGGGTNYPPVTRIGTNVTVGTGVRKSLTIQTNISFKLVFDGTPLNGENVVIGVSNTSASVIYWTNSPGIFDTSVASNVTTFAVPALSVKWYELVSSTNLNLGVARWELRGALGKEVELAVYSPGLSIYTNAQNSIITISNASVLPDGTLLQTNAGQAVRMKDGSIGVGRAVSTTPGTVTATNLISVTVTSTGPATVNGIFTVDQDFGNASQDVRPVAIPLTLWNNPQTEVSVNTDWHGVDILGYGISSNLTSKSQLYPFESTAQWRGTNTIGGLVGGFFQTQNSGTGLVNSATALRLYNQTTANGWIGTAYGMQVNSPNITGSGGISNVYGIYVDSQVGGSVSNIGISSKGINHFGTVMANSVTSSGPATVNGIFTIDQDFVNSSQYFRPVAVPITIWNNPQTEVSVNTDWHGVDILGYAISSNLTSKSQLYPFECNAQWRGTNTIKGLFGGFFQTQNAGTGLVQEATALRLYNQTTANGWVGTAYGLHVNSPNITGSGGISNVYGIYVDPQTGGNTLNVAIASPGVNTLGTIYADTVNATALGSVPVGRFTQTGNPGADAFVIQVNHDIGWYAFDVLSAGAYGGLFSNSKDGGATLTAQRTSTGGGTILLLNNAGNGTGDLITAYSNSLPVFALAYNGRVGVHTNVPASDFDLVGTMRTHGLPTNASPISLLGRLATGEIVETAIVSGGGNVSSNNAGGITAIGLSTNRNELYVEGELHGASLFSGGLVGDFALISDPTKQVVESSVTTTELATLSGIGSTPVITQLSNKVRVVAGANITVTPSGSGGVMTYTVAGSSGGGGTNYPPVIRMGTNVTVGVGVRQDLTLQTNASFAIVFTGTPLNGENVRVGVSNASTSVIYMTNVAGIYDPTVASNVTTFAVAGTSARFFEFTASTNLNLGVNRWELRQALGKEVELAVAGPSLVMLTNAAKSIITISNGILTASATLDFPSTLAQTDSDLPITVTGAATGDVVDIGTPAPLTGSCYTGFASNDTVYIRFSVYGLAAKDPASAVFRCNVTKP